ncbi:MAG: hypothetical protein QXI58_00800 [Candidatus Micrarchaeia archaeon]
MSATVKVLQANKPERKLTEINAFTLATTDAPGVIGPVYSIKKPTQSGSFSYSYWVSLSLEISGDFTILTNIRVYTVPPENFNFGTDGGLLLATRDDSTNGHGIPPDYYDYARGIEKYSGYYIKDPTFGHSFYKTQQASPINLLEINTPEQAILVDNTIYEYSPEPQETKHIVLQARVAYDAPTGPLSGLYFYFIWDEI